MTASVPARLSGIFAIDETVDRTRGWYEGLGWDTARADHVFVPFPLAGTSFALWSADSAGPSVDAVAALAPFPGTLLSLVVDTEPQVDAVLAAVAAQGARVAVPAGERAFGRAGWFVDPFGTTWEVCWISGKHSGDPFEGTAGSGAVATTLGAITVYGADPEAAYAFYAERLGWRDRATHWAGRPALATDGALLAFAPVDELHPAGPCGALMVAADEVDSVHDALVAAGARSLRSPESVSSRRISAVRDPKGLVWDIVADPLWACGPAGPAFLTPA